MLLRLDGLAWQDSDRNVFLLKNEIYPLDMLEQFLFWSLKVDFMGMASSKQLSQQKTVELVSSYRNRRPELKEVLKLGWFGNTTIRFFFRIALRRLQSLEKHLAKDQELREKWHRWFEITKQTDMHTKSHRRCWIPQILAACDIFH